MFFPFFSPTVLIGSGGQSLQLTIMNKETPPNDGHNEHNFTLEDQGIDQGIDPGTSETVTVTFPRERLADLLLQIPRGVRPGRRARKSVSPRASSSK